MTWIHMMRIHMTWIHMILWSHVYNDVGAFFQWLESPCQAVSHHFTLTMQKMTLSLTHSSVNGPSEKMTGLDNGLHHKVYTLEKEDRCHPPHGWTLQCPELCMFIGYVNYYRKCCRVAHISLNHWRINPVWQPSSWTDKMQKAFVQCVCS